MCSCNSDITAVHGGEITSEALPDRMEAGDNFFRMDSG
jgi:hypothetical protein